MKRDNFFLMFKLQSKKVILGGQHDIFVLEDEILWIPTVAVCDRIKKGKIKLSYKRKTVVKSLTTVFIL